MNRVTISWPPEHRCIVLLRRYAKHPVSERLTIFRSRPGICIAAEMLRAQTHARSIWQKQIHGKKLPSFSNVIRSWIQWMIQRRLWEEKCAPLADSGSFRYVLREVDSQFQEAEKPWLNYGAHWFIMLDLFQSCIKLGLVKLNSLVPDLNHCPQGIFQQTKALQGQLPRF